MNRRKIFPKKILILLCLLLLSQAGFSESNMETNIFYVKVFSENPRFGNLAGVVIDTKNLDDIKMQAIARQVNAETAFVFPSIKLRSLCHSRVYFNLT